MQPRSKGSPNGSDWGFAGQNSRLVRYRVPNYPHIQRPYPPHPIGIHNTPRKLFPPPTNIERACSIFSVSVKLPSPAGSCVPHCLCLKHHLHLSLWVFTTWPANHIPWPTDIERTHSIIGFWGQIPQTPCNLIALASYYLNYHINPTPYPPFMHPALHFRVSGITNSVGLVSIV
jgi:hypothetical protein